MDKRLPDFNDDLDTLKPFANIRLIVVDLDGTLLKSNNSEPPNRILEFSRKLKQKSIKITIATGRTLSGARQLLDKIQVSSNTPIILYNGGVILSNKYELLYKKNIDYEVANKILDLSHIFKIKVLCYYFGDCSSGICSEYAYGRTSIDRPQTEYNSMPVIWLDGDKLDVNSEPSAIVIHTNGDIETLNKVSSYLSNFSGISQMNGGKYIEVIPDGCNKGTALKHVATKILNIDREQVLSIGDNDNDAAMLAWSGIGVAVETASDNAKKSADFVAKRGVIDGAIEVFQLVNRAKRYYPIHSIVRTNGEVNK